MKRVLESILNQKARSVFGTVIFVVLSAQLPNQSTHAALGIINQFEFKTCGQKECVSLSSAKAFINASYSGYSATNGSFSIYSKDLSQKQNFKAQDFYYDEDMKRIIFHKINSNQEGYYDLREERLVLLDRVGQQSQAL